MEENTEDKVTLNREQFATYMDDYEKQKFIDTVDAFIEAIVRPFNICEATKLQIIHDRAILAYLSECGEDNIKEAEKMIIKSTKLLFKFYESQTKEQYVGENKINS